MPSLTGIALESAQAGLPNPLLSIDGHTVAPIYPYTASDTPTATSGARVYAPNIPIPAQKALTAGKIPSYFEDYYLRVHLLPSRIQLGSLASEQSRTVEVWNAYLTANTLSEIRVQGAEGMTLREPVPAPTVFGANEARRYQLSVTPNGPPTVNARFDFVFARDRVALRATGRRIVGWAFTPDWSQPVIERLEWLTQVMVSHAGREQRVRLRAGARRSLEYRLLLGNHRARVRLENLLHAWQARIFGLPLWQQVQFTQTAIAAGALTLPIDADSRDFEAGGLVGLVLDGAAEFAEITAVQTQTLALKSPLEKSWPPGTKLLPVKPARLQSTLSMQYVSDAILQTRARFLLEDEWLAEPVTAPVQYRNVPVLMTASNWTQDLDVEHTRKLIELDYLTGRRAIEDLSDIGTVRRAHHFLLVGRTAIAEFKAWLATRAGQLNPFWLPSFQADLALTRPIGAFDSAISVDNRGFAANGGARIGRRDILIATTDGQHYFRRITGATELTDTSERLGLDKVLGEAVLPGQLRYIAFMQLVRLDSDAVEIAHHTDQLAEVALTLHSLKDAT
ncbi:hypothetical protein AB833_17380 [Chromatiales bacterium (ex Bugula neritina AB1)]|nr:hypothetical protein AB833_17380 [Chromatiales bacterium (ex Bugula neritina AB1)]